MSAWLDIALAAGLVWMLVSFWLSRPKKGHPRHVWGELDSAQVAKALDKRRSKKYI